VRKRKGEKKTTEGRGQEKQGKGTPVGGKKKNLRMEKKGGGNAEKGAGLHKAGKVWKVRKPKKRKRQRTMAAKLGNGEEITRGKGGQKVLDVWYTVQEKGAT